MVVYEKYPSERKRKEAHGWRAVEGEEEVRRMKKNNRYTQTGSTAIHQPPQRSAPMRSELEEKNWSMFALLM
jgi:hypothetical protein